jgi:hypothetical protein
MDYNIDKQTKYKLKYLALKRQHIGEGGHTGDNYHDIDNNLYYQQIYLKYKSKYLALKDQHIGGGYTNSRIFKMDYDIDNNLYYQQKYFKYKLKYLDIKYGGTCKLKVDYDNNLDYQQKYLKYKSKYLDFKKQHIGEGGGGSAGTGGTKATVSTPATASKTPSGTKATASATASKTQSGTKAPASAPKVSVKAPAPAPAPAPASKVSAKAPTASKATVPKTTTDEKTVPYTLENNKVVTVSKKARISTTYLVDFLNDLFEKERHKDGLVDGNRYRDIETYINKVITDRSLPYKRNHDEIDYNFDNFKDVADMVEKVTDNAIKYHFKNFHPDKIATIMERVIKKYFYL